MKEKLRVLSLFSGIGAFEKALTNIGVNYDLVGFSEIDKYAIKSYCAIHNESEDKNLGDVSKVELDNIPNCDLITYGFPCQSFSVQGKKLGFEDREKGGLFFEAIRIAKDKKPKYMIAENVKNLISHDNGNTLSTVLSTLEDIGYVNYFKVLNSVNFGIPQRRERVFIVSIRKDIDKKFEFPLGWELTKTVSDFIDKENEHRHLKDSLKPFLDPKYHKEYTSKDGTKKVFDGNSQGYFNSDFCGKRMYSIYGVCPTLTTKTDAHNFIEIKSGLNGKERMMLQGFSEEDYYRAIEVCPLAQIKKQAGNSITVTVLEEIFKVLFKNNR